ncbi:MAG: FAD-dependent oxidoreductase [Candidatus Omnitrophica bacterium]|nr:FAD-dependent oxidoreductase [Candidatus Omnitrophota bacterium]MDD5671071.1 FAD-dependent oxidoreductase [Candidatus Omnitrophota bacterium]
MAVEIIVPITQIIQRTPDVKSFRVSVQGDIAFKAGQWLTVKLGAEKELCKPLSISNSPTEKGYLEFTKKITASRFSRMLNQLKPGDAVNVAYPFGKFVLDGEYPRIVFLSGGIGITPIRSMAKFVIDKNLGTDMVLLYGNNTRQDIAFKEDFDAMRQSDSKLRVVHVLWHPDSEWRGRCGLMNAEVIREEVPDYQERVFFLCGPTAMVDALKKAVCDELNVPKEKLMMENFAGY